MSPRVVQRPIEARALITIRSNHSAWGPWRQGYDAAHVPVTGALVRLYPPADASDELIAFAREKLTAAGAASVRLMPKPHSGNVVKHAPLTVREVGITPRRVVRAIVEEGNSADKPALTSIAETIMDEEGL